MIYKTLFTADWHLSNSLPHSKVWNGAGGKTDRLSEQLNVVAAIKDLAVAEQVNSIVVLGDVFDRRLIDAVTLQAGVEAIRVMSEVIPVWLLPGNHDANSQRGDRFLIEAFREMNFPGVTYMGGYSGINPDGYEWLTFYPVAWGPLSMTRERIEEARAARVSKQAVLLLHHGINGCKDGGWVCDRELDPDEVCNGFDLVMSGHFHDPQEFGDCGHYVGAPMAHDFRDADSSRRGITIVTFYSEGGVNIKRTAINSPRFFVRQWSVGSRKLPLARGIRRGDFLRIDVRATRSDLVGLLPTVQEYIGKLRDLGIRVMDPKCDPIPDSENRLVAGNEEVSGIGFETVIDKYLGVANLGGLDNHKLSEIGKSILRETIANDRDREY